VLRNIFGPKKDEAGPNVQFRALHNEDIRHSYREQHEKTLKLRKFT
jgi:hypothetical protein